MEAFAQCANHSIGPANQLFGLLIQTILSAQCAISPPDMWPKDFGPSAIENGESRMLSLTLSDVDVPREPNAICLPAE